MSDNKSSSPMGSAPHKHLARSSVAGITVSWILGELARERKKNGNMVSMGTIWETVQLWRRLLQRTFSCRYFCAVSPAGVSGLHLPTCVACRSSSQLGRLTCAALTNNPQIFVVSPQAGLFLTHATCPLGDAGEAQIVTQGPSWQKCHEFGSHAFPGRKREYSKSCIGS